ncbi:MAG: methyltransferase domain-containing protein [Chrysiogenales bacterium]|nr:MAG: methyltransferase domain-containing protein [Chrysiogenales bacterium]
MDVPFVLGDAGRLPFRDGTFDAVGIAFAFRNLTYRNPGRDRYLAEIIRVLAPGGRFVIVESSRPGSRIMGVLVGLYLKIAVSFFGGILSGQRGAYRYLARSAANFFPPGELADLLRAAGFSVVTWRTFAYGAAALHVAIK